MQDAPSGTRHLAKPSPGDDRRQATMRIDDRLCRRDNPDLPHTAKSERARGCYAPT